MKKKTAFIGLMIILALVVAGAATVLLWNRRERPVFTVGAYPVTSEHFALYQEENRAYVISYFYGTYEADSNQEEFWQQDFEGEVPGQMLAEMAKEQLIRDMTVRIEARKAGISTDVTLEEVIESLNRENKSRQAGDQAVYGPDQYGLLEYLAKTQRETEQALKEVLLNGELKPTKDQLLSLYQNTDPEFFNMGRKVKAGIFMYYGMKAGTYPPELSEIWPEVKERYEDGERPEDICLQVSKESGIEIQYVEAEYDLESLPRDNDQMFWLADNSKDLQVGEYSPVLDYRNAQGMFYILERYDYGTATFEEAEPLVENMWIETEFSNYMDRKVIEHK